MKKIVTELRIQYFAMIAGALMFACVVWMLPMKTIDANEGQAAFCYQYAAVLLTLGSVYFALRLFKYGKVADKVKGSDAAYQRYSLIRMAMLEIPLLFNIEGYWLFATPSYVYMAIIALIGFAFVYPSNERYQNERGVIE
jgi:tellurite resistance protein TehA-like permease